MRASRVFVGRRIRRSTSSTTLDPETEGLKAEAVTFFEHHGGEDIGSQYRAVERDVIAWFAEALSGVVLRRLAVDRGYQYAVDEQHARTFGQGLSNARVAIVEYGRADRPGFGRRFWSPVR